VSEADNEVLAAFHAAGIWLPGEGLEYLLKNCKAHDTTYRSDRGCWRCASDARLEAMRQKEYTTTGGFW
jgi:hypothetical protein